MHKFLFTPGGTFLVHLQFISSFVPNQGVFGTIPYVYQKYTGPSNFQYVLGGNVEYYILVRNLCFNLL